MSATYFERLIGIAEERHESQMPSSQDLEATGAPSFAGNLRADTPLDEIVLRAFHELRVPTRERVIKNFVQRQIAVFDAEVRDGSDDHDHVVDSLDPRSAVRLMFGKLRDLAVQRGNEAGVARVDEAETLGCFVVQKAVAVGVMPDAQVA